MPLEAINAAAAREKAIRKGHPTTLHLWWARRPLAACRAVLFAQLVDDPSSRPEEFPTATAQEEERVRLHLLMAELVKWENSADERVLAETRREIARSIARWRRDREESSRLDEEMLFGQPSPLAVVQYLAEKAPPVYDPFCGGGSIPMEAQRLGMRAHASDLNPVAALITKALIELPPEFSGLPPIHPAAQFHTGLMSWVGTQGLAVDVQCYGEHVRQQAKQLIGHLYPPVLVTGAVAADREDLKPYLGRELPVVAWLWARTVTCPNPTCGATTPLARTFWLSKRQGFNAWVQPVPQDKSVLFRTCIGRGQPPPGTVDRRGAHCLCCSNSIPLAYIRIEGKAGRLGQQLMAIVLGGNRERLYVDPIIDHEHAARSIAPPAYPDQPLPEGTRSINPPVYGMAHHRDLYTPRQRTMLATFAALIPAVQQQVESDARRCHQEQIGTSSPNPASYANAVTTYLGLGLSKLADYNCQNVTWSPSRDQATHAFTRQALPMVWDFVEVSPFSEGAGDLKVTLHGISQVLRDLPANSSVGSVRRVDARTLIAEKGPFVFSTDPPYYDNISYADLSDFFYVWLRLSLGTVHPELFETVLTPKRHELIAAPFREVVPGQTPREYFEEGLRSVFEAIHNAQIPEIPVTIYYAFKQEETDKTEEATVSSGWDSMLSGLLQANMSVVATWPIRTESETRFVSVGANALASSIVLVCRPRSATCPLGTRNEFVAHLRQKLPESLKRLHETNIAPVDLAQSSIGPGMAVFSSFKRVLEPDGSTMSVRTALGLINQVLDEVLTAEETEYDSDTRWAITWFTQYGFDPAPFGEAELLSKARTTSVQGLERAGIVEARAGKVRLLKREELEAWHPTTDDRFTIWEACQHLIKTLETEGEVAAARLLKDLDSRAGAARDLAYRLYQHCDRKGDAEEARAYNGLVVAWPRLAALAAEEPRPVTSTLDFS